MRLFIAIELNDALRSDLCDVMSDLRQQGVSGRFTRPENLHLTLAFIGNSSRTDAINQIMDGLPAKQFPLTLGGSGMFGDLLWSGVEQDPALTELADILCSSLRSAGFDIEEREFTPHITLVRRIRSAEGCRVYVPASTMTVDRITLMKSEQSGDSVMYTPVYVRRLQA